MVFLLAGVPSRISLMNASNYLELLRAAMPRICGLMGQGFMVSISSRDFQNPNIFLIVEVKCLHS